MLKVVVIDANAISRNLLTSVLVNGGHNVVGDSNTSSAGMANMIKLQPQLVCIDIGTPDDDGFAKLDTLRNGLPKSLIFLVSAKMEPAFVQRALEWGIHGLIVKPFNAVTVLAGIRNAIIKIAKQHKYSGASPDDHA